MHSMNTTRFHTNGLPTESLKSLFKCLGISISTLQEANAYAQKNFLRKGERWDDQSSNPLFFTLQQNKDLLTAAIKNLGMLDSYYPQKRNYDFILITGELKDTVQEKLHYLAELKKNGLTYSTVFLLGGERELLDEEKRDLPDHITTESQMILFLFQNHPLSKDTEGILINTPRIQRQDGTSTRPTTHSTLAHFATIAPHVGSCLLISNTPYIIRQTKIAQHILDQNRFPVEGIGKKMNDDEEDVFLLMDEFARTLYEICKNVLEKI